MQYTFEKKERLCSFYEIDSLIKSGTSIFNYPFKVVFKYSQNELESSSVKILISVPKRNFKRAVHRNYVKRRIREAYRLNKNLIEVNKNSLNVLFVYVGKQIADYDFIEAKLKDTLIKLNNQLELND